MNKCEHQDWTIYGNNRMGYAQCNDCGEEVLIMELFNKLHDKMKSVLSEFKQHNK